MTAAKTKLRRPHERVFTPHDIRSIRWRLSVRGRLDERLRQHGPVSKLNLSQTAPELAEYDLRLRRFYIVGGALIILWVLFYFLPCK